MDDLDTLYPCVGICTPDPDSGYCLGCGRPPLPSPTEDVVIAQEAASLKPASPAEPD